MLCKTNSYRNQMRLKKIIDDGREVDGFGV